jgi:prepilin-type N-terminal cleavage/methylation domain-containing protein
MNKSSTRRPGFTLVEMLIVLFIIAAVAAIFIPIALNLTDRNQVPKGASILENALHLAKSRAVAERRANGVRISLTAANLRTLAINPAFYFAWYDELQFIEDPGPYVEHWVWGFADPGLTTVVQPWWSIRRGAGTIGPAAPSPGALPLGFDTIAILPGPITIPTAIVDAGGGTQPNRIVNRNQLLFGPLSFVDWTGLDPLPKPFF